MRTKILIAGLMLIIALAACSTTDQHTSLVTKDGFAPYYTDLTEAKAAAGADQHLVIDFYTDW